MVLSSHVADLPERLSWILAAIRDLSLGFAVAVLLGLGTRHVRRTGLSFRTLIYPLGGALLVGALIIVAVTGNRVLASSMALLEEDPDLQRNVDRLLADPSSSAAQRALASRHLAKETYFHRGIIVTHLTETGELKEFEPSRADEEIRLKLLDVQAVVPAAKRGLQNSTRLLPTLALASLLAGCFSPIRNLTAA